MKTLLSPATLKPFTILVIYFMMYQFSGVNTVTFYAVDIFKKSGTTWDGNTCAIFMGSIRVLFTIVACILMRRCGRRPLTFVSSKFNFFEIYFVTNKRRELNELFNCRHWLWSDNGFIGTLLAIQIQFGSGRSTNRSKIHLVPSCLPVWIYNLLHTWIFGRSMGYDRRIVSTKSSWFSWWNDHIRCSFICIHRCQNIPDAF